MRIVVDTGGLGDALARATRLTAAVIKIVA